MQVRFNHKATEYVADLEQAVSIAMSLDFAGPQLNHFGVPPATAKPLNLDGFVGDTRQGGSCNVTEWSLVPHCNGTHTETVGHLAHSAKSLPCPAEAIGAKFLRATLVTIDPVLGKTTQEKYQPDLADDDYVITSGLLNDEWILASSKLAGFEPEAVVIRTLSADDAPTKQATAFFTHESIAWLNASGIEHLLVDLPSIDRANDDGRLSNHRLYWGLPATGHELANRENVSQKTITEMIRVPKQLADGNYLLNLQVPEIRSDAVPSRPLLIPIS